MGYAEQQHVWPMLLLSVNQSLTRFALQWFRF
jgi:hypothetical protein